MSTRNSKAALHSPIMLDASLPPEGCEKLRANVHSSLPFFFIAQARDTFAGFPDLQVNADKVCITRVEGVYHAVG